MSDEFYVPDKANLKPQSAINKQGRDGTLIPLEETMCYNTIKRIGQENYNDYLSLLGENPDDNYNIDSNLRQGLSRELARAVLPLNNYTELYWKIDLNNFFHYVKLRADYHAQWEIQELARAMYSLIVDKFPLACEAYEDYIENATTVSRMERDLIKRIMSSQRWLDVQEDYRTEELLAENYGMSKRELSEFIDKWNP